MSVFHGLRRLLRGDVALLSALSLLGGISCDSKGPTEPEPPPVPAVPQNVTVALAGAHSVRVTWTANAAADSVVSYSVYRNDSRIGDTGGTSYVDANLTELSTYSYSVTASSRAGRTSARSSQSTSTAITIPDATPPTITSATPGNGATNVPRSASVSVVFSEPMDASTIGSSSITVRSGGSQIAGGVAYTASTRTATFTPSSSLPNNAAIEVTVTSAVKDAGGNALAAPSVWTFTTRDEIAPTIVSTNPQSGATSVATSTAVTARFNEALDLATIGTSTFTLRSSGGQVAGSVQYDAASFTATFTPSAPLAAGTTYTADISTGVKDLSGNALASAATWSFTTASVPAPVVLAVVSTSPANGAVDVSVTSKISATFNNAINVASLSVSTFAVTVGSPGAAVSGSLSYDAATKTITFSPSAGLLANDASYTVRITTGLRDSAGTSMSSDYGFGFRSSPDRTPPAVSSVTPASGAADVATSTAASVTFTKPMNAATITPSTFRVLQGGTAVAGAVSYDANSRTAIFTPSAQLANSTVYTVRVESSVTDIYGIAMSSAFSSTFTTVAAAPPPPSGQSATGYWSGTDDGGAIHWHFTLTQSGTSIAMSASCKPSECTAIPLTQEGFDAVGSGIPVDESSISGTYVDPSMSFTITLVNGRTFNFNGYVSVSGSFVQMKGTMTGPSYSRTITLTRQ